MFFLSFYKYTFKKWLFLTPLPLSGKLHEGSPSLSQGHFLIIYIFIYTLPIVWYDASESKHSCCLSFTISCSLRLWPFPTILISNWTLTAAVMKCLCIWLGVCLWGLHAVHFWIKFRWMLFLYELRGVWGSFFPECGTAQLAYRFLSLQFIRNAVLAEITAWRRLLYFIAVSKSSSAFSRLIHLKTKLSTILVFCR